MSDPIKQDLTIRWIVARRKLVQFTNDKTYKLADSVLEHIKEIEKRKTNIPVEVIITPKNQNEEYDLVTFIAIKGETHTAQEVKELVKEPEKKEEPKVEEKKVVEEAPKTENKVAGSSQAIYTVKGYSKERPPLWWLFEELGDKTWLGVDSKLLETMSKFKKGDKLSFDTEPRIQQYKGIDRTINYIVAVKPIEIKTVESSQATQEKSPENKKSSYSNDSQARAKNTAIMVAKDIVVAYVNSKAGIVDTEIKVGEMLKRLTKVCYETIESL